MANYRAPNLPNLMYVVWDDVGMAVWEAFGGLVKTPAMSRLAARGLRYSQWHAADDPRSTRSYLLTGRESGPGQPGRTRLAGSAAGQQGLVIPPESATVAEILAENGYHTYCLGKWHLSSPATSGIARPRRTNWPLERGFERCYAFLDGQASGWYPDMIYDNQHVDSPYPPAAGYHLNRDLTDMALEFIRNGKRISPGRPWFCYLTFGTTGAPDAAPREWTRKYSARFEMGYDRYREIVLTRMKRLGAVPGDAGSIPARQRITDSPVRPWRSLSDKQKRLCHRFAESYAGLCSYTDDQIGRLLDYLHGSGQLENTIVVVCSASSAGIDHSPDGLADETTIGADPRSAGWARAFAAPYDRAGEQQSGGIPWPLIISWPEQMDEVAGETCGQYHHAADIVPTLLDCAGITQPRIVNGYLQEPLEGDSMRYTFTRRALVPGRESQTALAHR
jgi:arylsulfatase A-like enzyme